MTKIGVGVCARRLLRSAVTRRSPVLPRAPNLNRTGRKRMINSTPRATWNSIAATLEGVEKTATICAAFLGTSSQRAMAGADDLLFSGCLSAWKAIGRFRQAFGHSIPAGATEAIDRFAAKNDASLAAVRDGSDFVPKRVFSHATDDPRR